MIYSVCLVMDKELRYWSILGFVLEYLQRYCKIQTAGSWLTMYLTQERRISQSKCAANPHRSEE